MTKRLSTWIGLAIFITAGGSSWAGVPAHDAEGIDRLRAATGGGATITLDRATGTVSFVRLEPGAIRTETVPGRTFHERTSAFLDAYGSIFGLRDHTGELELVGESTDSYGLAHVRYRQIYHGIPVFGSELKSHFDRDGKLVAINASTIPIEALDPTPAWQAAEAENVAVAEVIRTLEVRMAAADLHAVGTELLVFRTGMLQGISGTNHLAYRVEVVNDARSIREFVFVNAHTGKVLDQITGIHDALNRRAYDGQNLPDVPPEYPASPFWVEGDPFPTTSTEADNMILASGETYNLFVNAFARDSFDGAGATMDSIFDRGYGCPNASWNGTFISFCPGFTTDDVTAHEWGHAYTDYTNNLIYQWQSGALNESYSDIWGETVDLINGRGLDSPDNPRSTGGCSNYSGGPSDDDSYRWLMGEEVSGFGALRDMWNPPCNGDPGKVSDTEYFCSTDDGGGVHTNSGVPNHAYALMVDGGTYNGKTITALGLTKAAHIHWVAQNMLTPASDFADQADALEAACTSLIGVNLPDLSTGSPSGIMLSAGDCTEVGEVVDAVEFRTDPAQCGFQPLFDNNPPALCAGLGTVQTVSSTDWEGGLGTWTAGTRDVANPPTFDTPDWAVVGSLPDSRAGMAAFVADLNIGDCITDDESGVLYLESPVIALPGGALVPRVAVDQWMVTEALWDGGNVKIDVNSGGFNLIPGSAFEVSPYNGTLNSIGAGNTNPMAGEDAFTGADGGALSGSWGASHINLQGIAAAGDNITLRFELGIDGCGGAIGWYVDEVQVYSCSAELPPSDCGNGVLDPGEVCDDGNAFIGDGCSNTCQVEAGWNCTAPIAPGSIPDNSFEAGPGGSWTEYSLNFGTPVCDVATCGTGTGTGPSEGTFWVWFGGIAAYEEGSVFQNVTIPSTATNITFDLEQIACDSQTDYMEMLVDGSQEFVTDGASALCGTLGYVTQTVDISAYADGGVHSLEFHSEIFAVNLGGSNFFLDRIELPGSPSACTAIDPDIFADGFESGNTSAWSTTVPAP